MNRPYIICHMVTSIDGKVTGNFLSQENSGTDVYYQINRDYRTFGSADGYACGRVTMQGSFCGEDYPDLSVYKPVIHDNGVKMDYIVDDLSGFYAVAFDPHGRLGWKSNRIDDADKDPGYDKAQLIEVLTEQVDERYLTYLEALEIPYIFAGKTEIDVELALFKLKNIIGINTLLLEGGSIVNGGFAEADVIDAISLVVAPIVADTEDKPLFMKSKISEYKLAEVKQYDGGVLWLNYKKQ